MPAPSTIGPAKTLRSPQHVAWSFDLTLSSWLSPMVVCFGSKELLHACLENVEGKAAIASSESEAKEVFFPWCFALGLLFFLVLFCFLCWKC